MKKILLLFCACFVVACDEPPRAYQQDDLKIDVEIPASIVSDRIKVERIAIVRDRIAYGDRRGVYIITDTKTGTEYIGVSGIGITETGSHMIGKMRHSDEQ